MKTSLPVQLLYIFGASFLAEVEGCICDDKSLCAPLLSNGDRPEFFGFSLLEQNWRHYNFSTLTTVAWNTDPQLVCLAHAHKTRVVINAAGAPVNGTAAQRKAWVDKQVAFAQQNFLDGINFDFEGAVRGPGQLDPLNERYVALLEETTTAFHSRVGPGTMVSVDVAWSPNNIDGRAFPYLQMANATDLLFVMSYDTRSQIYHQSLAAANTPIQIAALGLRDYLALGVPPEKLVMGFPWYGYNYTCNQVSTWPHSSTLHINHRLEFKQTLKHPPKIHSKHEYTHTYQGPNAISPASAWRKESKLCPIECVPFRGAPCSDAAGGELNFAIIQRVLRGQHPGYVVVAGTENFFDPVMQTPFFNYERADGQGSTYQMWYDNPTSMRAKVAAMRDVVRKFPGLSARRLAGENWDGQLFIFVR